MPNSKHLLALAIFVMILSGVTASYTGNLWELEFTALLPILWGALLVQIIIAIDDMKGELKDMGDDDVED